MLSSGEPGPSSSERLGNRLRVVGTNRRQPLDPTVDARPLALDVAERLLRKLSKLLLLRIQLGNVRARVAVLFSD